MKYGMEKIGNVGMLTLDGELTIREADSIRAALIYALDSEEQVTIDLERATEVDLSCIQLLCSAHRSSLMMNKRLSLAAKLPEAFRHAVEEAGFLRHTGCAMDCRKSCLWAGGKSL